MIESFTYTIFPWLLLNGVSAATGGMILSRFNQSAMGVFFGMFLGPIGLLISVMICQWRSSDNI